MSSTAARRVTVGLAVCLVGALAVWLTSRIWTSWIGNALVCDEHLGASDALLVENFDPPDYLLFERAAVLQRAGLADRVLVPGQASRDPGVADTVAAGFVEVMARVARLRHVTFIPVSEHEPISLGVARQVRSFLLKNGIKSVILVSSGLRSRRSQLVYTATLDDAHVKVMCEPVIDQKATPSTWPHRWHGIQNVGEQSAKLLYYRLYVLPFYPAREFDREAAGTGVEILPAGVRE